MNANRFAGPRAIRSTLVLLFTGLVYQAICVGSIFAQFSLPKPKINIGKPKIGGTLGKVWEDNVGKPGRRAYKDASNYAAKAYEHQRRQFDSGSKHVIREGGKIFSMAGEVVEKPINKFADEGKKFVTSPGGYITSTAKTTGQRLGVSGGVQFPVNSPKVDLEPVASFFDGLGTLVTPPRSGHDLRDRLPKSFTSMEHLTGRAPKSFTSMERLTGRAPKSFTSMERLTGRAPKSFTSMEELTGRLPKSMTSMEELTGRLPKSFTSMEDLRERLPKSMTSMEDLRGRLPDIRAKSAKEVWHSAVEQPWRDGMEIARENDPFRRGGPLGPREHRPLIVNGEGDKVSDLVRGGYTRTQAEIIHQIMWGGGLNEQYMAQLQASTGDVLEQLLADWWKTHGIDAWDDAILDQLLAQAYQRGMDRWLSRHGLDLRGNPTDRTHATALRGDRVSGPGMKDDSDWDGAPPSYDHDFDPTVITPGKPGREKRPNRQFDPPADSSADEITPEPQVIDLWPERFAKLTAEIRSRFQSTLNENVVNTVGRKLARFKDEYKEQIGAARDVVGIILQNAKQAGLGKLKEFAIKEGKKLLPGVGVAVGAHEVLMDMIDAHEKDVLARIRANGDPSATPLDWDWGSPSARAAELVVKNGYTAFQSPEGLWFVVKQANYTVKSGHVTIIRPNSGQLSNPRIDHNPSGQAVGRTGHTNLNTSVIKHALQQAKGYIERQLKNDWTVIH